MKVQMVIVELFVLVAFFIISNQNIHLAIVQEREIFLNTYSGWIANAFNQVIHTTGYIIRFDWLPK